MRDQEDAAAPWLGTGASLPASEAPGSRLLEAEGHRAAAAPDLGSRRAESFDKGVFIWTQTKQLLLVTLLQAVLAATSASCRKQPLTNPSRVRGCNEHISSGCASARGYVFLTFSPPRSFPVSKRPAPVTSLTKKPLETGALYTCLQMFMWIT